MVAGKSLNRLNSILSTRSINLSAHRILLLCVVRPTLEYGNELWDCNRGQANALESITLGGAKVARLLF